MGLFNRKQNDTTPADPATAELGREYAIAKRHGDRKTVRRITRELGSGDLSQASQDSFHQGRAAYDAIPPVQSPRRRNRR